MKAAVIGAGIMGMLLARELRACGWSVIIHEKLRLEQHEQATSFAAGGMLAPFSELESAEPLITTLGLASLKLWPDIIGALTGPVFYQQHGSLLLSHVRDVPHYEQLVNRIRSAAPREAYRSVAVASLEPELAAAFPQGLYLPDEAHLDNRQVLRALRQHLLDQGVIFHCGATIQELAPNRLIIEGQKPLSYDLICDCRGIGAADDLADLRSVRGEAFLLHAPGVTIQRPVRLMHPRYAVYIAPRAASVYYVGATSIESASTAPVTVRSALELLSAAFSVHSGFGEATILESFHGQRPAFADHKPRIAVQKGKISINGLYRHGFLLAPKLAQQVRLFLEDRPVQEEIFTIA